MSSPGLSTLPMTAPDQTPQNGYRRPATFSELPLVTVLVAAALVLAVGLSGGSVTKNTHAAFAANDTSDSDQVLAAAAPVDDPASALDTVALAPVGPMADRSDLATASDRDPCDGPEDVRPATVPRAEPTTDVSEFLGVHDRGTRPSGLREGGSFHRGLRHGDWIFLHEDGSVRERGSYADGLRDGLWETFSTAGALMAEEEYFAGGKHGDWRMYANSGDLIGEGHFEQNLRNGRWTLWYSDGSIKERGRYDGGLREGGWEFFDDLGQPTLRSGMYRAGIRIN